MVRAQVLVWVALLATGTTAADVQPEPSRAMEEVTVPREPVRLGQGGTVRPVSCGSLDSPIPLQGEPPEAWSAFEAI